tara:strand:+ start:367 stop:825 length:459 start_codon:yes stop_codon:yes gene_type:complete
MFEIVIAITMVIAGHFFCALLVYLNHRFVFHSKLGNLPLLKNVRRLHSLHHAHAYNEKRNDYILVPIKYNIFLAIVIVMIGIYINVWFAAGIVTFSALYSKRHYDIHNNDKSSVFFSHHRLHHINPKYNFSGIYPFIDAIFKTKLKKKSELS